MNEKYFIQALVNRKMTAAFCAVIFVFLMSAMPVKAANEQALRLFPTHVVENLKQTGQRAKTMEAGLQDVIKELETQMELFTSSKCSGFDPDAGCSEMARQLGTTYTKMLDIMADHLPAMEASVSSTRDSLKKRIANELGTKMSPRQLQEMIQGESSRNQGRKHRSHRPGRMRLSEKFKQYLDMVSMASSSNGGGSLAMVASEIYMDTEDAAMVLALTRDEIARARLMAELNQSLGTLTPEMVGLVKGVKEVLFGENADTHGQLPDISDNSDPENFVSPLAY